MTFKGFLDLMVGLTFIMLPITIIPLFFNIIFPFVCDLILFVVFVLIQFKIKGL